MSRRAGCMRRASRSSLSPLWQAFWQATPQASGAELDALVARVRRRAWDDGASYNAWRPWLLALAPVAAGAAAHAHQQPGLAGIEAGIRQRARMPMPRWPMYMASAACCTMACCRPTWCWPTPATCAPCIGCRPPGGVHLHVLAVDLARCEDGRWWVVGQRTQVPSGLGYIPENRLVVAQQFPQAFREMGVQRPAASYRDLLAGLTRLSPAGRAAAWRC